MRGKKVIILCGLIGSGKTTYAQKEYPIFTDLDYMPPMSRKIDQINWTFRLLKKYDEVCHITCFPTEEEVYAFKNIDKTMIWIDTSLNQAKTNILIRNRPRDMIDINRVLKANYDYEQRYIRYASQFKVITIFGRGAK